MIESEYKEKRSETRHYERYPLRVQGTDACGHFFVEITLTENISTSGLCVTLEREVAVGQHLQIFFNNGVLHKQAPASTKWVTNSEGRWQVGLKFERPPKGWHANKERLNSAS
jgi:hypothetical protein